MRKVRTALDTAIRTKNVRSFSGRSGWSGRSIRGHLMTASGGSEPGISGYPSARSGWRRQASAAGYRKEAIASLTPAQRRAFEKLPEKTKEELLIKAEKRIDRRISAGRYREYESTAALADRTAGIRKGRLDTRNSRATPYSERVGSHEWSDGFFADVFAADQSGVYGGRMNHNSPAGTVETSRMAAAQAGRKIHQGQENENNQAEDEPFMRQYSEAAMPAGSASSGYEMRLPGHEDYISRRYRNRKRIRQQSQKMQENRLRAKREAAKETTSGKAEVTGRMTGMDKGDGFSKPAAGSETNQSGYISGNQNVYRSEKKTSGKSSDKTVSGKAGKKITHDYARTLGRMVETQVRFTKQLESGRAMYQKQKTMQEMEEKEARRAYRIVSFSLSKMKAAAQDLVKAAKFLASKGKGYLILLLVPVMLLVMMVPLLLSSVSMTEEEATASATATELVEYALSWVGVTQYVWGAGRAYETDWQDYTDCSGFVHGVFSHFGYEIGGDTVSMEGSGTLVATNSTDKALPGDIILFFTGGIASGNSTHVGIYIGNGQMVHCSGGRRNTSPETAGPGVMITMVSYDSRPYQVRRIIPEDASGGVGTGGHRVDPTNYSLSDLQLIWAIVAQEDNGSYEGALAVISSAMNRTESPTWSYLGNTAMKQLCAPGQYCYSNDHYWEARLGGNVPEYVKQAVNDCLKKGIRNHSFTSFRSTKGKTTGPNAVQIGGNWFFGN